MNQTPQPTTEQPDYIKCVHDERRGMLISNPPQYRCEYCGNTWVYQTPTPVCNVLKAVYEKATDEAVSKLEALILEARIDEASRVFDYINPVYDAGDVNKMWDAAKDRINSLTRKQVSPSKPTNSTDKPPMLCGPCNLEFPGIKEIKAHFKTEHPVETEYDRSADVDGVIDDLAITLQLNNLQTKWLESKVLALLSDQVKAALLRRKRIHYTVDGYKAGVCISVNKEAIKALSANN